MFWLVTLRNLKDYPGHAVDPWGNVWSYFYRGGKNGATRPFPHRKVQTVTPFGYMVVNVISRTRFVHTLVASAFLQMDKPHIDHINRDRTDNRLCNLRTCTRSENNRNVTRSRNCKSRFLGVSKSSKNRYVASLMVDGVKHTRSFRSELAAAAYRDHLAITHHGEFCSLNFPPECSELFEIVELFDCIGVPK